MKRLFSIAVGVLMVLASSNYHQAQAFNDVSSTDWFSSYTAQLAAAGIIANNADFHPYRSISRAELAKMAVKAAEYQHVLTINQANQSTFCDVDSAHWAITFVETLVTRGAVQGSAANCTQRKVFFPNNAVTRAEALKILLGVYGIAAGGATHSFTDIETNSWYGPYVGKAATMNLINPSGNFRPHAHLSRAEMSKLIVKLTEYVSAHPDSATTTIQQNTTNSPHQTHHDDNDNTTNDEPTPTPSASPSSSPSSTSTPLSDPRSPLSMSGELTFYALGDSLTAGDRDEHDMGGYPARLQSKIEAVRPGSRVINIGISGNDSGNLLETQLTTAVSARPDGVLVLIGSNDMWMDCWNENTDTSAGTIDAYRRHMETIMSRLHGAGVKIFVGLVDDQPRRPGAIAVCDSVAGRTRMSRIASSFNTIIREKAATYTATTVDFYSSTIFYSASTLSDDGNHPNAAGYEAMARLWFGAMQGQLAQF